MVFSPPHRLCPELPGLLLPSPDDFPETCCPPCGLPSYLKLKAGFPDALPPPCPAPPDPEAPVVDGRVSQAGVTSPFLCKIPDPWPLFPPADPPPFGSLPPPDDPPPSWRQAMPGCCSSAESVAALVLLYLIIPRAPATTCSCWAGGLVRLGLLVACPALLLLLLLLPVLLFELPPCCEEPWFLLVAPPAEDWTGIFELEVLSP